ncbi:MAG: pyruvate formate lyase family protein, partial [Eubacteriales bacterium]
MSRISELRIVAYQNGRNVNKTIERDFLIRKAVLENPVPYAHNIRRGEIDRTIFENYSIEIDHRELLVGRFSNLRQLNEEEQSIYEKGDETLRFMGDLGGVKNAFTGHRVIDYEKLLSVGIKGVLEEIENHLSKITYQDPEAAGKKAFYTASKISLEGVCNFAKRYEEVLLDLYEKEEDSVRKEEYQMMANNFHRAPYLPCTHFYEALQCMWFMQFCLCLIDDISLTGRIDNYLYPYYKKDIESGYITEEFAFELIESLYLKHNEIYDAWPAALMLGGVDRNNQPVWNELTYMCIDAIETTGLVNPAVSVCYTEDMPDDLLQKCIDKIAKGYTRPALFNDKIVQEGLRLAGVSVEDSRYYVHSTCVEITPIASSNILVATPYINLNKAVEYILNGKKAMFGDPCGIENDIPFSLSELTSFDKFYQLVKDVISEIIRTNLVKTCDFAYHRANYSSSPLSSAFLNDCLNLGKDSGAGGAKYNFVYPCFPGFLNLVDSLQAIKTAVYDERVLSLKGIATLCHNNFAGEERWRKFLMNRCDKFGNGKETVDALGKNLYDFLRAELEKYEISIGGKFYSSYFAWI